MGQGVMGQWGPLDFCELKGEISFWSEGLRSKEVRDQEGQKRSKRVGRSTDDMSYGKEEPATYHQSVEFILAVKGLLSRVGVRTPPPSNQRRSNYPRKSARAQTVIPHQGSAVIPWRTYLLVLLSGGQFYQWGASRVRRPSY